MGEAVPISTRKTTMIKMISSITIKKKFAPAYTIIQWGELIGTDLKGIAIASV